MASERIAGKRFPSNTFLVLSKPGIGILKNVHIAGEEFKQLNLSTSIEFIKEAFKNTSIKEYKENEIGCLSVLRSGPHYGVAEAYERLTKKKLQHATIGVKRKNVKGKGMIAEIYSEDLNLLDNGIKYLFTSEIIASGATLKTVFSHVLPKHKIKEWTIFSIAAADEGCNILKQLEDEHGIKINLFANGFIGGLKKNKTDIPFFHPNSIMPKSLEAELKGHYGVELFKKIPCCIGDGGERFLNPKGHYEEFIKRYSKIKVKDEKSAKMLNRMLQEAKEKLNSTT